jgi:hypothetical protein
MLAPEFIAKLTTTEALPKHAFSVRRVAAQSSGSLDLNWGAGRIALSHSVS